MNTNQKYRPVVFMAGGERGTCGGRHFDSRWAGDAYRVTERIDGRDEFKFNAANLGEIREGIEALVAD